MWACHNPRSMAAPVHIRDDFVMLWEGVVKFQGICAVVDAQCAALYLPRHAHLDSLDHRASSAWQCLGWWIAYFNTWAFTRPYPSLSGLQLLVGESHSILGKSVVEFVRTCHWGTMQIACSQHSKQGSWLISPLLRCWSCSTHFLSNTGPEGASSCRGWEREYRESGLRFDRT